MVKERDIGSMNLHKVMDSSEWKIFKEELYYTSENFKDIIGVVAVGSLIQSIVTPKEFYIKKRPGDLGTAYESIRNPYRRKSELSNGTDLDLWLCLKDNDKSFSAQDKVEIAAMALLEELASGTITRGDLHWSKKKNSVFSDFYKNEEFYTKDFADSNNQDLPWMAQEFKNQLEKRLISKIPDCVNRINDVFDKKIPGGFLEIRAFPESLFHLRPDDVTMSNGVEDRMPFPRIADDQWLSPRHTLFVFYSNDKSTIYPINKKGRILGEEIDKHIKYKDNKTKNKSYCGILIKPDAIQRQQLEIILEKIKTGISKFNGRIIIEKKIAKLTENEVEILYPLLRGDDLRDAKKYLASGETIAIIIEAPLSERELFKFINYIKGPRVADRSDKRLIEGRIANGAIRDLLPLCGDENLYQDLIQTIIDKRKNPKLKFSEEQYKYYSRNLVHTPDNSIELKGLFKLVGFEEN